MGGLWQCFTHIKIFVLMCWLKRPLLFGHLPRFCLLKNPQLLLLHLAMFAEIPWRWLSHWQNLNLLVFVSPQSLVTELPQCVFAKSQL